MEEIQIPHAIKAFIDKHSQVPREILVVVTSLPKHSPAGPEADARWEMLQAIGKAKAEYGLHGEEIIWGSGNANGS